MLLRYACPKCTMLTQYYLTRVADSLLISHFMIAYKY